MRKAATSIEAGKPSCCSGETACHLAGTPRAVTAHNHPCRVGRATLSCHATAGRQDTGPASLTPGYPHGTRGTEELTLLQRRGMRAAPTLPGHGAAQESPAAGARACGARAPCKPRAGPAASHPQGPLGSPRAEWLRGQCSWLPIEEQGAAATQLSQLLPELSPD